MNHFEKFNIGMGVVILTGMILAWFGVIPWTPVGYVSVGFLVVSLALRWWKGTLATDRFTTAVWVATVMMFLVQQYIQRR